MAKQRGAAYPKLNKTTPAAIFALALETIAAVFGKIVPMNLM